MLRKPPLLPRRLLAAAAAVSSCCSGCPPEQTDHDFSWAPVNITTAAQESTTSAPAAASAGAGSAATASGGSTDSASGGSTDSASGGSTDSASGGSTDSASGGTASLATSASSAASADAGTEEFAPVSGPGFEGFIMRPVGAAMWRPSQSEIHELEAATPVALGRAIDAGQIPEDVDLKGYVRQYRGDRRQKRKLIRIDYYCESAKDLAAKHAAVSGGGSCFVHASYDPESGQFLRWWSGSLR